jgi:hypothetical protein
MKSKWQRNLCFWLMQAKAKEAREAKDEKEKGEAKDAKAHLLLATAGSAGSAGPSPAVQGQPGRTLHSTRPASRRHAKRKERQKTKRHLCFWLQQLLALMGAYWCRVAGCFMHPLPRAHTAQYKASQQKAKERRGNLCLRLLYRQGKEAKGEAKDAKAKDATYAFLCF